MSESIIESGKQIEMTITSLYRNSVELINYARNISVRQVNMIQLMTFFTLGKWIVEEQQNGENRAKYGKQVIIGLSEYLNGQFGKGFSEDTLKNARKFYLTYKERISDEAVELFAVKKSETVFSFFKNGNPFTLPWSHYLLLMRIKNDSERSFYEIEAARENWSIRTLQRQYNSSLYERIALSRNKDKILERLKK